MEGQIDVAQIEDMFSEMSYHVYNYKHIQGFLINYLKENLCTHPAFVRSE